MNLKPQNKDSLEDAVSNSPDPSKKQEGLEKSFHRCKDKERKDVDIYRSVTR